MGKADILLDRQRDVPSWRAPGAISWRRSYRTAGRARTLSPAATGRAQLTTRVALEALGVVAGGTVATTIDVGYVI